MGIDAVALLRPRDPRKLRHCAAQLVALDDGAVLFRTFLRHDALEADPTEARLVLEGVLRGALATLHDDARGVFLFPDICEPSATTYDALLAELQDAGFWVPLDDSPEAAARARAAKQAKAEAQARRGADMREFGALARTLTLADLDADPGLVAKLQAMAESIVRIRPGTAVWCVLVRRRTPFDPGRESVNEVLTLPDGATAVHGVNLEDLDSLAWRLADVCPAWTSEHDDPRGVPAFSAEALGRVRDAASYEDALARLGADVHWVVPKGIEARMAESAAKVEALFGATAERGAAAKKKKSTTATKATAKKTRRGKR